jgi:hypothetical protein
MATRGSNPSRGKIFFFFLKILFNGYCSSLLRVKHSQVVNLTTHVHLVLRLRIRKATHLLPQYAFMPSLVEENICNKRDELTT